MNKRYVCVHGHFSARRARTRGLRPLSRKTRLRLLTTGTPCISSYAPNGVSRIRGGGGRTTAWPTTTCFNFGATLLSWMADDQPGDLVSIVEGDWLSTERRTATATPLARCTTTSSCRWPGARSRRTQVKWGMADFRHRGRDPEGIWLAETAASTMEALAEGVRYTILSPQQATPARPGVRTGGPS